MYLNDVNYVFGTPYSDGEPGGTVRQWDRRTVGL